MTRKTDARSDSVAKFAELVEWGKQDRANLYRRVARAAELLADPQWIADRHEGQWDKAYETIEAQCFCEFAGLVKLQDLLNVLKEFPAESDWKRNRYDLLAMLAVYDERRAAQRRAATSDSTPGPTTRQRATIAQLQTARTLLKDREDQVLEQGVLIDEKDLVIARQKARIDELETEVRRLSVENRQLKARVERLEQQEPIEVNTF